MTDLLQDPDRAGVNDTTAATEKTQEDKHPHKQLMDWMQSDNIAADLPAETLSEIGSDVWMEYDTIDLNSCRDHMEKMKKAMDLAMQVSETKQYPWPRASNVIYPLMTTAAIQFAARAYPAIISGRNVVRGVVIGDDSGQGGQQNPQTGQTQWQVPPGAKLELARKIGDHMSYQLLDEQPEWEEETDKLLHILPIAGCCFRKTYYDPAKARNVSILVPANRVILNYYSKSIETAPRITEELTLYPVEILENERAGVFRVIQYNVEGKDSNDKDGPRIFLEQHRWWDLDDDGFPEPYVVTIHKESREVVRIVARYDHDGVKVNKKGEIQKIDPIQYYTKYDFLPNPEGGIYGVGFGQLLRPINEAVNTSLNMLIDSGHLANTGGGFIGKSLSMHTGSVRFTPGEYKAVNVTGATVKENIVPLSFPGPSPVLFQLLGTLIEAGKEIAAVKDVLTGEQKNANVPASTTLALIEQGLKVFTAIYKRIHRAFKQELSKLYRLNSIYLPDYGAGYRSQNEWKDISKKDYRAGSGVEPISDPSMVSDMQKLGRAQFLMQFMNDPWFNGHAVRQRILDAALIEKPMDLLVQQPPPNPELQKDQAELEIRRKRMEAETTKDYANAMLFLTQASKLSSDEKLSWYEQALDHFRAKLEQAHAETGTETQPGADTSGLPEPPSPPLQQNDAAIPSGLPPSPQGGGLGLPPTGGQ